MQTFPTIETRFLLQGPVGNLEVLATPAMENSQKNATAIICHPHPLHAGTMHNKIVSTLMRVFRDLGLKTVRFNFRGVGESEGTFDEGRGEQEDLYAVLEWVKLVNPQDEIWLGGFSFGAAIAATIATKTAVAELVTIAPPVPRMGLLELPQITCPWILVQGDQDEIVVPEDVYAWIETRHPKPTLIRIPDAGHFFHGKLLELRQLLVDALE